MGKVPTYLTEQLGYVRDVQPMATTTSMQFSLFSKGLKLFNVLPEFIKVETNFNLYKRNIVQFVKNNEMNNI